ncbi:hypothetical protein J007_04469 [Cryptococcus neoformans]|nr:hypothetical protein J007_04469 [Cryptococcus neoformans var. grubii]
MATKGITERRSQIVLTAAGSGKSMVWILLLLAMKMHKQSGILILFGVTKATQDDQIRTLKRLHFEANFLNGDSPRDVRQKLAEMKGQLWAIGSGMLQNHLVQEVLGKSALTGKTLSRLVDEAHTIKEGGPSWRPDILKLCEIRDILGPSSATGLFSAIMSPDRDELKYEVRPFRAKMDTYADLGIISQEIYFLWFKPLTTTPTAILSLSSLSCNFSSFPPTTSHTASPMTTSTSGRKEVVAQRKEPEINSLLYYARWTTSQPSSSTRRREEEGAEQKDNASESLVPRAIAFFATKQQGLDTQDALRSI